MLLMYNTCSKISQYIKIALAKIRKHYIALPLLHTYYFLKKEIL